MSTFSILCAFALRRWSDSEYGRSAACTPAHVRGRTALAKHIIPLGTPALVRGAQTGSLRP